MSVFEEITLSAVTLIVAFVIPFTYLARTSKERVLSGQSKANDFLYIVISVLAGAFVLLVLFSQLSSSELQYRLLVFLHLGPPLITLMTISRIRDLTNISRILGGKKSEDAGEEYQPEPLNSDVEDMTWDDLIIGPELKAELQSVIHLLQDSSGAQQYGIDVPKGILLNGPPGTGKTSLAKVVANTAGLNFFSLRMDDVISKWVGESEKNLTKLFEAAQKASPAVIFIDEVDSIGKTRSSNSQAWADNLLNHLLQLIDGVVKTEGLYVIAATNRAELVDPALKRPGRLNKVILVPLPNSANRRRIFELHLSKLNLGQSVDLDYLAKRTHGVSGATIQAICNQAGLNAFQRESMHAPEDRSYIVTQEDLLAALNEFVGHDPTAQQPMAMAS